LAVLIQLFLLTTYVSGQVTVSGSTCVFPGVSYQYNITGNWDSTSTTQICITGGSIKNFDSSVHSCTLQGGAPLGSVLVSWNNILDSGTIAITSDKGNATLSISIISPLVPGRIDSSSKLQAIDYDSIPSMIICSVNSGGSCSPVYFDQWQQSFNQLSWTDIEGAINQNLVISSQLTQPTFYRRKVTEQQSGTIAYSDVALVDVRPASVGLQSNIKISNYGDYIALISKKDSNLKTF
jgi:hypothetical protein